MFIGDDETPPECLQRRSRGPAQDPGLDPEHRRLGYSPEQYYYSLIAFADRFRPHFVVVSLFTNDFGDGIDVSTRRGRLGGRKILAGQDHPVLPAETGRA